MWTGYFLVICLVESPNNILRYGIYCSKNSFTRDKAIDCSPRIWAWIYWTDSPSVVLPSNTSASKLATGWVRLKRPNEHSSVSDNQFRSHSNSIHSRSNPTPDPVMWPAPRASRFPTEYGRWPAQVQRLQGPDVQPQVLADRVQEPLQGQDGNPKGGAAQGRAAGGGLPGERRRAVGAGIAVHAQGRHPPVWRLRVRHLAPEHCV